MAGGSVCPNCGYRTEQLSITCPRCRQPLKHEHCQQCGRCPGMQENVQRTEKK